MNRRRHTRPFERGMVLVTSLLLLVVVTILAVGLFRSFGIDEKIAGNMREKQRALQAAESAEEYAEYWLASGNAGAVAVACNSVVTAAVGQVCASVPTNPAILPWSAGVSYAPPNMDISVLGGTNNGLGTYYATPIYYITLLGVAASGLGTVYQIDAAGYGGSSNTAAVVEATFQVSSSVKDLGAQ
jgi:type IV pilus assembly protein PilX